jgi:hypothetical protein
VAPLALPLPLPFPRVFAPDVLRFGDIAPEHSLTDPRDRAQNGAAPSAATSASTSALRGGDVESVPCLTRLGATTSFKSIALARLQSLRREPRFLPCRLALVFSISTRSDSGLRIGS